MQKIYNFDMVPLGTKKAPEGLQVFQDLDQIYSIPISKMAKCLI